jgi:hypothetical protein
MLSVTRVVMVPVATGGAPPKTDWVVKPWLEFRKSRNRYSALTVQLLPKATSPPPPAVQPARSVPRLVGTRNTCVEPSLVFVAAPVLLFRGGPGKAPGAVNEHGTPDKTQPAPHRADPFEAE